MVGAQQKIPWGFLGDWERVVVVLSYEMYIAEYVHVLLTNARMIHVS